MEQKKASFVYMVKCLDDSLYTGITKDVRQRMHDHYFKTEKGAKYTRSRQIVRIMMVWEAVSYSSAARLEYAIKHIQRKDKLKIIKEPEAEVKKLLPHLAEESYVPRREYIMDITDLLGINDHADGRKVLKNIDKDGGIC